MANKVEILNLDINTSALLTKMGETRAEIERLQAAQKQLTASNQTTSNAYQKNAVELSRLQTSYNQQKAVVIQLSSANNSFAQTSLAIADAIAKENLSIAQARENNTQLLTLRNQLNLKTDEGKQKLAEINAKLDENNKFIKTNVSAYEQQKIGIGDYKNAITSALNESGIFSGKLAVLKDGLSTTSQLFGAVKNDVAGGALQIKNAATATDGLSTSQKAMAVATNIGTGAVRIFTAALAATGIGLIIIAIALLIGYFKTFDPLIDKIEQGMAAMGAAVRVVQQTLVAFLSSITSVGDAISKLGNFLLNPIDSLKKMGSEMANAAKEAAALKAAQQDLADQQSIQEVANAKAAQQYAELILQSKNRTLSEQERLKFLKQAEAIETANFNQRTALADKELANAVEATRIKGALNAQEIANLKKRGTAYAIELLNLGKITQDEVDLIKKAELAKIAIKDESTKRLEKNQNAQDKLEEDRKAKQEKAEQAAEDARQKREQARQKAIDASIQKSKDELDLFIQQQGFKKKSLEEELAFEKQVLDKKLAILKQEYDAKKITQTAYQAQALALTNEFAKKQADTTISEAQRELDIFKKNHQTKLNDDKFFSEQKLQNIIAENNAIQQKEAEFQLLRLQKGIINQQQYNDAIDLINENTRIKNEEAQKQRDAAKKEQQAIDLENQRILDEEKFTNEFDLQTERERIRYEAELAAAEKTGASKDLITKKHANIQQKIEEDKEKAKLQVYSDTFGAIAGLLGEATAAGKAAAIAQATINTYQGVTAILSAKSVLPEPAGGIAKIAQAGVVLATGLMNVGKIAATKVPSRASGGIIPTLRSGVIDNGANLSVPLRNGDDTLAYVKQGEMILNEEQQRKAGGSAFFRSIGVPSFASGGSVGGYTSFGALNGLKMSFDYDLLASKIAQANTALPNPVVSVVDISDTQNRVAIIEQMANF
ncbi:coiled-coil domain-containing protein [Flavobacterium sedimenticola]|uniref:Bacteriophage tail tape measure N-terminal domain-containing protein n=1 Tax=Flavobacterium sedimenticola TaxID=3043286 RepID=A0ABT6XQB4_9FLAO|nr:hypothetical protein [Flavobacterium sedimenticola]MDI9257276.1 hypothetical protein [Flavobacterium sedimenticola]